MVTYGTTTKGFPKFLILKGTRVQAAIPAVAARDIDKQRNSTSREIDRLRLDPRTYVPKAMHTIVAIPIPISCTTREKRRDEDRRIVKIDQSL